MLAVNMAAQTNPKAKMTPKIRYVHSNRISDRFSGASDKNLAEKVDGPAPRACWNAASRPLDGRARAARYAFRLSGALSTFAMISSMSTCPWVIQSVRARGPVHGPAPAMTRDPHPLHRDIAETAQLLDELREALPGVPPEAWLAAREQISKLQHHVACLRMLLHPDRLPFTGDDRPSPGPPFRYGYSRTLTTYFVSDDFYLVGQVATKDFSLGWSGYIRPTVVLTYLTDFTVWGLNPIGFHLTNVLLHAFNAALVGALAAALLRRCGGEVDRELVALGSVAFLALPCHSESVSWISGRTDLVASAFMLLAILAHVTFLETRRHSLVMGSLAMFALALLSKESAVVLPVVIGVLTLALTGRLQVALSSLCRFPRRL